MAKAYFAFDKVSLKKTTTISETHVYLEVIPGQPLNQKK
jgi:hypothetical protein